MTSAAKLLRFAHLSRSEIVIGDGQGALTGLLLTKPSFMEVMLQMRNFQAEELRLVSMAWGQIRGVVSVGTCLSRSGNKKFTVDLVKSACPRSIRGMT